MNLQLHAIKRVNLERRVARLEKLLRRWSGATSRSSAKFHRMPRTGKPPRLTAWKVAQITTNHSFGCLKPSEATKPSSLYNFSNAFRATIGESNKWHYRGSPRLRQVNVLLLLPLGLFDAQQ